MQRKWRSHHFIPTPHEKRMKRHFEADITLIVISADLFPCHLTYRPSKTKIKHCLPIAYVYPNENCTHALWNFNFCIALCSGQPIHHCWFETIANGTSKSLAGLHSQRSEFAKGAGVYAVVVKARVPCKFENGSKDYVRFHPFGHRPLSFIL